MRFQHPVAAAQRAGGDVGAGGHVASSERGQPFDQLATGVARGHVTAVDEHIGVAAEGTAPAGDFTGARQQAGAAQLRAAQQHHAVGPVAQHMQSLDVVALGQQLGDAGNAVFASVQRQHFKLATCGLLCGKVVQQRCSVGHRGVDHHNFYTGQREQPG